MIKNAAITFLWIIHVSAIIGIALEYDKFFLEKSPWTMLYLTALLFYYFPIRNIKTIAAFVLFFTVGMTVEWIGVHTSILFGDYVYLENFGPKIDGIPLLIGINWALLTFCSHVIANYFTKNIWTLAALAALLMVILDLFLEQICSYAGFWRFEGGAGWFNYLCWFVIAYFLHLIASRLKIKGDLKITAHLYIVQLLFAAAIWIIISTT